MMDLYSRETIRYLQNKYGFRTSKGLGQNFLTDPAVLQDMITGSGLKKEDLVIEIGPGIGVLTAELSRAAARVLAIELDDRLMPILEETLRGKENVQILQGDVLKVDLKKIIREQKEEHRISGKVHIMGNLPYYITTPILMKLLEEDCGAESITLMMQKEVADRIKAAPGGKDYGAISLAVQFRCQVKFLRKVGREAFQPQPKVDSAVLHLQVRREKAVEVMDEKLFFRCIRAGFGQRRKTLLNSLSAGTGLEKEEVRRILEEGNIDGGRRAETLTMEEFARIADCMKERTRE